MARRLVTALGVDDDLQAFAAEFVRGPLPMAIDSRQVDGAMVSTLAREGVFQVELCCVRGGMLIPQHLHPHADTIEIGIAGGLRLQVNGVDPFAASGMDRLTRQHRAAVGVRINHDDWHGTVVPPCGSVFLSVQRWSIDPLSVLTDYIGCPIGTEHGAML